ncbi:MAG: hypothetical protein AAFX99_30315, partial [Myxococcota bacterium]
MAKKFSSLLVQDNVVSIEKMEEALQRQVIFGGRLGTNLLEMGVISEAELVYYLAAAHDTRPAETNHYTNLDPDAIALLDIETVERLHLLPIRIHPGKQVDALIVDPLDPQILDGLQRMTNYGFVQYIAPEFRFLQALNQFFGRELPRRIERLLNRFPQPMRVGTSSHLGAPSQTTTKQPKDSQELHSPLGAPSSTMVVSTTTSVNRDGQLGLGWDPQEVTQFLRECYSRDTCLELLLGFSGNFAQRRVLMVVARNRLQGYDSAGWRDSNGQIRRFKISIPEGSLLDQVCQGDNCYQGDPEGVNVDLLYQRFELLPPEQIVLIPIRVGPRAGLLLMLDDHDLFIDIESLTPLFKVVNEASIALERIIKLMKRNELPPRELRIPPLPARYQRQQNVGKPPASRNRRATDGAIRYDTPPPPESSGLRTEARTNRPEQPDRPRSEQALPPLDETAPLESSTLRLPSEEDDALIASTTGPDDDLASAFEEMSIPELPEFREETTATVRLPSISLDAPPPEVSVAPAAYKASAKPKTSPKPSTPPATPA